MATTAHIWPTAMARRGSVFSEEILCRRAGTIARIRTIHFEPVGLTPILTREHRAFWMTMPCKTLMAALISDALTGTILMRVGLPGPIPLPWPQTFALFGYATVSRLVVNDTVEFGMIKWRVPTCPRRVPKAVA